MSRHCSSVKSVGYDLSFIAPLPQNLTPTRRVNNSPDQMSRDNNCLKFSKPCNGHALKGLVKNWWASDTSLKDNAMEASDATNSFVRNHAGVSDQVLDQVWGWYGKFTGPELIDMTHEERPWKETWGTRPRDGEGQDVIDPRIIREFFKEKHNEALENSFCGAPSKKSLKLLEEIVRV